MSVGPEQRLSPEERANLVAYIDGELTENESRVIATKLSLSATARREVESLKKTWELLEYLPRPKASDDFPERTLTSHTLAAKRGPSLGPGASRAGRSSREAGDRPGWSRPPRLPLGFVLTRWVWPDPAVRMARDLSLAEHLEEYQEVGSFQFLDELAKSKEFGGPSSLRPQPCRSRLDRFLTRASATAASSPLP